MAIKTISGPYKDEQTAQDIANAIDSAQCSVYSVYVKDSEGYDTSERQYYVERDDSISPAKILGYATQEFMAKQYR